MTAGVQKEKEDEECSIIIEDGYVKNEEVKKEPEKKEGWGVWQPK